MTYQKREILQPILDDIEPGWTIFKPSADNDVETACIFQHVHDYRQAEVEIPNEYFSTNDFEEVEGLVKWAITNARRV